jgi:hypothetical protein
MEINKIRIPTCSKIKKRDKCTENMHCVWNNVKCENEDATLFDHYVKIVRSKSGRYELENIAKQLNVKYQDRTIKKICEDIQEIIHVGMHSNTIETIAKKLKITGENESDIYYKIYKYIFDKLIDSEHTLLNNTSKLLHTLPIIPGYVNFNTDKVVYKNEYKFADRIEYADKIKGILSKYTNNELCELDKGFEKIKKIGSKSIAGEAYIGYNGDFKLPIFIAIKIMPVKSLNLNEVNKYELFTRYVTDNKSPHFPIMYKSNVCSKCKYDDTVTFKGRCITVLNELANGDLKSYLKEKHTSIDLICIFGQLIMTCLAMEHENIVHHDMHWGNYLFHNVPEYKAKYIHYRFTHNSLVNGRNETHNVYIKNNGVLFVGWDFSDMTRKSYSNENVHVDLYRIFHINRWAPLEGYPSFPKEADDICTEIKREAKDNTYSVSDLLMKFNEILKRHKSKLIQKIIYVDPVTPPPVSKIINDTPYVL